MGIYENIIGSLKESNKLSWTQLYNRSGIKDKTKFDRYLKFFCDRGIIDKNKKYFSLSKKYFLEPLRFLHKNIIMDTSLQCIFSNPPGFNNSYYSLFSTSYLKSSIKNFDGRIKKIEKKLKTADSEWMKILAEARNNFVKELWNIRILNENRISVLTKSEFGLKLIFELQKSQLLWIVPDGSNRSLNDQMILLNKIVDKAFNEFIQNRYPIFAELLISNLRDSINKEIKLNEKFFKDVRREILSREDLSIFEHLIVIGIPGIGWGYDDELVEYNIIKQGPFDSDKPIEGQLKRLRELSNKQSHYDEKEKGDKKDDINIIIDDEIIIKPPFFNIFFKNYEMDLLNLGFKKGKGRGSLKNFYNNLDETARKIRIPVLPDNPDLLLHREVE